MTQDYGELLKRVRDASTSALTALLDQALGHASLILNQQHKHTGADAKLAGARPAVLKRFVQQIEQRFEHVIETAGGYRSRSPDFSNLSLVETDVQDAQVALQGMATHARNCHINELLRFTVRLNAQFYRARVDETNNPLDPGILADAFNRAISPLGLGAAALLDVYRQVNKHVFHNLEPILQEVNQILSESGARPSLENLGRTRGAVANRRNGPRPGQDANTRAFSESGAEEEKPESKNPGVLEVLVTLLRRHDPVGLNAVTREESSGRESGIRILDRDQLRQLLVTHRKQGKLDTRLAGATVATQVKSLLKAAAGTDQVLMLDRKCADMVGLASLLFDAVERDAVVPDEPKNLLRETWVPLLQLTLTSSGFFANGGHPVRVLLNEFAAASIGWSLRDRLEDDPLYRQARQAVQELVNNPEVDLTRLDALAQDFLAVKRRQLKDRSGSSSQLLSSTEGRQRLEELHDYARHKIAERIDGQPVPLRARELLEKHYSKFMIKVLRRDGPGGDSWKPVMDTMDVLLWSVRPGKTAADFDRLARVNDKLMSNLSNALKIAGLEKTQSDAMISELKELQQHSQTPPAVIDDCAPRQPDTALSTSQTTSSGLADDDPAALRCQETVRNLNIGAWLEFDVHGHEPVRCTLASRIPSIDWLIFVNRQGVKMVEKSGQGLARELVTGSARLIDGGRLMDRAIDTVMADLRSIE